MAAIPAIVHLVDILEGEGVPVVGQVVKTNCGSFLSFLKTWEVKPDDPRVCVRCREVHRVNMKSAAKNPVSHASRTTFAVSPGILNA